MKLNFSAQFPHIRLRRARQFPWLRDMIQEKWLTAKDLIWPIFIRDDGDPFSQDITGFPDVKRYTLAELPFIADQACRLGISALALFPCVPVDKKSTTAKEALNPENLMCRAFQCLYHLKNDLGLIADIALDPYTSHGHDGVLVEDHIDNDKTLFILAQQAVLMAEAGAHVVGPSNMMDGSVASIRQELDKKGFQSVSIMAYSAKFASAFYGPFRDAIGSSTALKSGTKETYQLSCANAEEALREVAADVNEGADFILIKPGGMFLDILTHAKQKFQMPTFGYQVSGEYAMLKAASDKGWLDFERCLIESLMCFKRAGADGILTYGAPVVAKKLQS